MTPARLAKLEREWADRLRTAGFQDLESPGGWIPSPLSHGVSEARTRTLAQLEQDRNGTHRLQFAEPWQREAWGLHLDGHSNREIGRRLGKYRKAVDLLFAKCRKIIRAKGRGRPRDPDGLRSGGLRMEFFMSSDVALALDHLSAVFEESAASCVRRSVIEYAKKFPHRSENQKLNFAKRTDRPWSFKEHPGPGRASIYALVDWRDDTIRYIGQTQKTPRERLSGHWGGGCTAPMRRWIRSFPREKKAEIVVLGTCEGGYTAGEYERKWIRSFVNHGYDLYNHCHAKGYETS